MARFAVKERLELGKENILAPERYDPRRDALSSGPSTTPLGTLVRSLRTTIQPHAQEAEEPLFLVLDTSDASDGIAACDKRPVPRSRIGSAKKLAPLASVIISRLRPYLRQVAFIDDAIDGLDQGVEIACSTEFFVLVGRDERSIAFLVPFLLSEQVQAVLRAAQEGGHHPRFDQDTLLGLPVPTDWLCLRDEVSADVETAISRFRAARKRLRSLIDKAEQLLG